MASAFPSLNLTSTITGRLSVTAPLRSEMCCIMFGVPIGYSSPLTMMDSSSKVKLGTRGDCSVLRPTMVAAVPMVLDRVVQVRARLEVVSVGRSLCCL